MHDSIAVAMSGGVDSSVAAWLLRQQGEQAVGVTMRLFVPEDLAPGQREQCHILEDLQDAQTVAGQLGIPHHTLDLSGPFQEQVMEPFVQAYEQGRTPNPCVTCNRTIKFGALLEAAGQLGCGRLATGHYARRRWDAATGRWQLLRACDPAKDQSYVLYHLTQDTLAHMLFPLGELTKGEVRELARARGFVTAAKPESQDICFVPDGDYARFIEGRCGADTAFNPGEIVDREGRVLGGHAGLIRYTIGQRKGLGIAAREPLYVLAKDTAANRLIVGFKDELLSVGVVASDMNFISGDVWQGPREVLVKTHYRQHPVPAVAEQTGVDELTVAFDEPQRAAAPGQAAVLYEGDIVLGGGTIARAL